MDIAIIKTGEKDVRKIVGLIREFAEYEGLSQVCEVTEAALSEAMFGEQAFVEGLMAFDGERAVGYALFYPCFATFRGQRGFWLEDIFITADCRTHNLGEQMLREIARIGKARGIKRIDFLVLDWNTPAIGFYKKHGAVKGESERYFKFTDEAFLNLASD